MRSSSTGQGMFPLPPEQTGSDDTLQNALQDLSEGRYATCLPVFRTLAAQGRLEARFGLVVCLAGTGDFQGASALLCELEKDFPDSSQVVELRIQLTALENQTRGSKPRPFSLASESGCGADSWGRVSLVPETLAARASRPETWRSIISFHHELAHDAYVRYTDRYYRDAMERYGDDWKFWDIINVLYAAADLLKPRNYLEIGVRRGRSACTVVHACPDVDITAFDMWVAGYGDMNNPGPDFVRSELERHGHRGSLQFVDGNSHETLPRYLRENPATTWDLMTVDGDHSEAGAEQDLMDALPRLSVGGVVVFDDISHPAHPYLLGVWRRVAARFPWLSTFEWGQAGYGIAFGIRKF